MQSDDARLVASIAAKSPIAFTSELENVATPDKDEGEENNPWSGTVVEPEEQPEPLSKAEVQAEQQEEESDSDFSDWSEAAITAKLIQEKRPDIFDDEPPKDMSWDGLIEKVDGYITGVLKAGVEYQMESVGQARQYVEYLLNGGSPEVLQNALTYADITNMNLDEANDDELSEIYMADLKLRDLNEDDIKQLVETAKVSNSLKEKAAKSQETLREREKAIMQREMQRRAQEQEIAAERRKQLVSDIETILNKPAVMGMPIDTTTRQRLKKMIFERTEPIEYEHEGKVISDKITRFVKLKQEFDNNLEAQIAFALLLDKGFNVGVEKKDNDLMEELRKRSQTSTLPKVKSGYLK